MKNTQLEIDFYGQTLRLFANGALCVKGLWVISDVHIGRVMHLRKNGYAISAQAAYAGIDALDQFMQHHAPDKLLFLGDLFHAQPNSEWEAFAHWRSQYGNVEMVLVEGNHDRHLSKFLGDLNLHCVNKWAVHGLHFTHIPPEVRLQPHICGHVHPKIMLKGKGRQRLSLPCFYITEELLIMPAFSLLSGGQVLPLHEGSKAIAIGGGCLWPVP